MNKILMCAAVALAAAVAGMAQAKDRTVEKIIAEGTANPQVGDHLDVLTGRFGGRLVGSAAFDNAANWMLYKYAGWGIPARKEEAGQVPVGFNRDHWQGRACGVDGVLRADAKAAEQNAK